MVKKRIGYQNIYVPEKEMPIPPHPRGWRHTFPWRIFRILAEFVEGFHFLADLKKTVTIFGSARFPRNSYWYQESRKLGKLLSKRGFSVVTGGGPGIMEAANLGALEGKNGESIGINILLPYEQRINPYIRKGIGFYYFFTRKVILSYSAQAYVFFPGGYGTIDELLELLVLISRRKIRQKLPLVLIGQKFWSPLDDWFKNHLLKNYKTLEKDDVSLYYIVNSAEEAFAIIKKSKPRKLH